MHDASVTSRGRTRHLVDRGIWFYIDDTDLERSKPEFQQSIKEHLKWLGITWTKTFNQSKRQLIYQEKISRLKTSNRIYPCFESAEELVLKRKSQLTSGKPPIYDRSALKLTKQQIESNLSQGKKPHWRFKLEEPSNTPEP